MDFPASQLAITVIIPAHNPKAEVLKRVLIALRAQSLATTQWEAVLVDNGSSPSLDAAAWRNHLPELVVVPEPRLGLTYARLAGIAAARGALVVFADDDNVFAPDYLEQVVTFMRDHAKVGVCGGRIIGEFAIPPAAWARPHLELLALRDHGAAVLISQHPPGPITSYDYFAPLGAGLVVRSRIAAEYATWVKANAAHLTDRRGTALTSGGDCEIVMSALKTGWQLAYVPELQLTHVIPTARLTFDYLARLNRAGSQCWAEFLRRHGLARPIPRWTVPLRQFKALFPARAWTRTGRITWRGRCGYFTGLAG